MKKFVLILTGALALNAVLAFIPKNQSTDINIEFDAHPVSIESGQPVYKEGTEVIINNPRKEKLTVQVNDSEGVITEKRVSLSALQELQEDTYTVIITSKEADKTYGFTIR